MRLYNTLSRKTEELQPLEPGVVRMYSCGPTVYRFAHLGNMRTYLMADWIRRALEIQGLRVIQVKNITDVGHMRQEVLEQGEDKMIASALAEGKNPTGDSRVLHPGLLPGRGEAGHIPGDPLAEGHGPHPGDGADRPATAGEGVRLRGAGERVLRRREIPRLRQALRQRPGVPAGGR